MLSSISSLFVGSNANMSNDTKYFLIPASSGLCIQPGYNKTETANVEGNDNQLWQIEQGKSNKIAFKNVDSGDYLRATGGSNSNAVNSGARQWWVLEASDTPNGYWFVLRLDLCCQSMEDAEFWL